MANAFCLYFHAHQPFRIKQFTRFRAPTDCGDVFDDETNASIVQCIADRCYEPANQLLEELLAEYPDQFAVSLSISGTLLEQCELYRPRTLQSFQRLASSSRVELIGETYHHSLSALHSVRVFQHELFLHREALRRHFSRVTTSARNTELLYRDDIGAAVAEFGFESCLLPGPEVDTGRHGSLFRHPSHKLDLCLRNDPLSDEIGFRFPRAATSGASGFAGEFLLSCDRYLDGERPEGATEAHSLESPGLINLYLDYETLGEHYDRATGIFGFLREFVERAIDSGRWEFVTPSMLRRGAKDGVPYLSVPKLRSWADTARDESAWLGNHIQEEAFHRISSLVELAVAGVCDDKTRCSVLRLSSSDHLYFMSTKSGPDGEVHRHFSPFSSPYDAFVAYTNVLDVIERQADLQVGAHAPYRQKGRL